MKNNLMDLILKETEDKKTSKPEEITEKEDIMVSMAEYIDTLDDDSLDDNTLNLIDKAFDALFDVIISLEEEDLDDKSEEAFLKLMKSFDSLDSVDFDLEEAYKYKAKKVAHGKRRSQSSRMTGSEKHKYIKNLKKNRKKYKRSASLRNKRKKKRKKYDRTAGAKQTKRIYKSLNK